MFTWDAAVELPLQWGGGTRGHGGRGLEWGTWGGTALRQLVFLALRGRAGRGGVGWGGPRTSWIIL